MKTVLFLDDDENRQAYFRSRVPHALIVATAADAITAMCAQKFDFIFLDHDLGGKVYVDSSRKDTGMEVVRWLHNQVACEIGDPEVIVHSMNGPASQQMLLTLSESGYRAARIVFGSRTFNIVAEQLG